MPKTKDQEKIEREREAYLKPFLRRHEASRTTVYDDGVGVPTIGIGFNLTRPDAREICKKFSLDYNAIMLDYEQNVKGRKPGKKNPPKPTMSIDETTIDGIYQYCVENATKQVRMKIDSHGHKGAFDKLPVAWQAALISHAYNGPSLIKNKISQAARDSDPKQLAKEIINDIHWTDHKPQVKKGITARYTQEAALILEHSTISQEEKSSILKQSVEPKAKTLQEALKEVYGISDQEAKRVTHEISKQNDFKPEEIRQKLTTMAEFYKKNTQPSVTSESHNESDDESSSETDDEETIESQKNHGTTSTQATERQPLLRQNEIQQYNQCLDFLGGLGDLIGCKPLKQGATVCKALIVCFDAVNALCNLGASVTAGAVLGPVGMIGGAALAIFNAFASSGPNPTQIILDQLGKLSEQIAGLQEYIGEQFGEMFKLQYDILDAINTGFYHLSQDMANQIGSMRVDFDERFNRIEAALTYLVQTSALDIKELHLNQLRSLRHEVHSCWLNHVYLKPPASGIPKITEKLHHWITVDSSASFHNGMRIVQVPPPLHLLKSLLHPEKSTLTDQANSLISFLAARYDSKLTSIPNPQIWYEALEMFLQIKQQFILFDRDPDNRLLPSCVEQGEKFNQFIEQLQTDDDFWKKMFTAYYQLLSDIQELQDAFINNYSASCKEKYDEKYAEPISDQPKISAFNVFQSPDLLIAQFANRSINHLSKITSKNVPDFTNNMPIFDAIKEKKLVSQQFLCAEYLGLVKFSAQQNVDVIIPPVSNPILDDYNSRCHAIICGRGSFHKEGNRITALVGQEFFADGTTEWLLPMQLNVQSGKESHAHSLITFKGSYQTCTVSAGIWDEGNGNPKRWCDPGGDDGYIAKLKSKIPGFIRDTWNDPKKKAEFSVDKTELPLSVQVAGQIHTDIENEFVAHRKNICYNFLECKDQHEERSKILVKYQQKLDSLDIHVKIMQLLAHSMGKKSTDTLDKLITSAVINADLNHFLQHPDIAQETLTLTLSQALKQDAKRYNAKDIIEIAEDLDLTLFPSHPLVLFHKGMRAIENYKISKKLFLQQFPNFSAFTDIHVYTMACFMQSQNLFELETYEWLSGIDAKSFQSAKFWLTKFNQHFSVDSICYREMYQRFYEWLCNDSRRKIVTGEQAVVRVDFNDIQFQQMIFRQLPRGWEANIALLMQIASQLTAVSFVLNAPIANFKMWADGMDALLQLLLNDRLQDIAHRVGNTTDKQLSGLTVQLETAKDFQHVWCTLGTSTKLFKKLFGNYIALLMETKQYITERNKTMTDEMLYRQIINAETEQGNFFRQFNQLTAYTYCIKAYCQMLFGQALVDEHATLAVKLSQLFDKDYYSRFISINLTCDGKKISLQQQLNDLIEHAKLLQQVILAMQKEYKNIVQAQGFLQKQRVANFLCLSPDFVGKEMTDSHIKMILQYILQNKALIHVEIRNLHLNREMFCLLLQALEQRNSIVSLKFINCQMTDYEINLLASQPGLKKRLKLLGFHQMNLDQYIESLQLLINNFTSITHLELYEINLGDVAKTYLNETIRQRKNGALIHVYGLNVDDISTLTEELLHLQTCVVIPSEELQSDYSLIHGIGSPMFANIVDKMQKTRMELQGRIRQKAQLQFCDAQTETEDQVAVSDSTARDEGMAIEDEDPVELMPINIAPKEELVFEIIHTEPLSLTQFSQLLNQVSRSKHGLKKLVLTNSGMLHDVAMQLYNILKTSSIQSLILDGNDAQHIAPLYDLLSDHANLTISPTLPLDSQNISSVIAAIRAQKTTELSLKDISIDREQYSKLKSMLSENCNLTHIAFSNVQIAPEIKVDFYNVILRPGIISFQIVDTPLQDDDIKFILRNLDAKNSTISILRLCNLGLSAEKIRYLLQRLSMLNLCLTTLALSDEAVTSISFPILCDLLFSKPALQLELGKHALTASEKQALLALMQVRQDDSEDRAFVFKQIIFDALVKNNVTISTILLKEGKEDTRHNPIVGLTVLNDDALSIRADGHVAYLNQPGFTPGTSSGLEGQVPIVGALKMADGHILIVYRDGTFKYFEQEGSVFTLSIVNRTLMSSKEIKCALFINNDLLICGCNGGVIRIFDIRSKRFCQDIENCNRNYDIVSIIKARENMALVVYTNGFVHLLSYDNNSKKWDRDRILLRESSSCVTAAVWLPHSVLVLGNSYGLINYFCFSEKFELLTSQTPRAKVTPPAQTSRSRPGSAVNFRLTHFQQQHSPAEWFKKEVSLLMQIAPNILLSANGNGEITLWDINAQVNLRTFTLPHQEIVKTAQLIDKTILFGCQNGVVIHCVLPEMTFDFEKFELALTDAAPRMTT